MVFIKGGDVNALLGYKLKLNFPPAIPLELLMRARCALVLYSDSFKRSKPVSRGLFGLQEPHYQIKTPPVLTHIRVQCPELVNCLWRCKTKIQETEGQILPSGLCHVRHD